MTDPRNRLRPLLHSGVDWKVRGAIESIIANDDPALYDWVLEAVYLGDLAMSKYWMWRYDDTQEFRHPSLESEQVLRLIAYGTSALAARLRGTIKHLGIELGFNRRNEPFLDVSMLDRLTEVTKLRLMPAEGENLYEWRATMMKAPPKLLRGFASIAGMTNLEHLTIIGGAGVELAPLVPLTRLEHLELVACDTTDTSPLARTAIKSLTIAACPGITALDALPPTLERLEVEDLPALGSIEGLTRASRLQTVVVAGVPLARLPAVGSAAVTFQPQRPVRTAM